VLALALAAAAPTPVHVSRCSAERNVTYDAAPPVYPPRTGQAYVDVYGHAYRQPPLTQSDPALRITYANDTHEIMKAIDFGLEENGAVVAEVRDSGTFAPGAQIRHVFGLSRGAFPIRQGRAKCVPLMVRYANGTTWKNSALPMMGSTLYKLPH
jgi:hypothetical protein